MSSTGTTSLPPPSPMTTDNVLDLCSTEPFNVTTNLSPNDDDGPVVQLNLWSLLLFVFPVATAFGNGLVCASVWSERSLQTVTNYFIVSLAIADLMVAVLVMPLAVYVEVTGGDWGFGDVLCDTWIACDVMCCTASILNLAAISVDRFTAVTRPISYARQKTSRRVYVMIAAPWIVSLAISSPIALGLNQTAQRADTPRLCTFYNSDFLIYSSMGSFYVPTVVMMVLYWRVYLVIRSRRSNARQPTRSVDESAVSCMATAPRRAGDARQRDAVNSAAGSRQVSNGNATLSARAMAALNDVQRRSHHLARQAANVTGTDANDDGTMGGEQRMSEASNHQSRAIMPPIAVIEPDDLDEVSPRSISAGFAPPPTAQLTPLSSVTAIVDASDIHRASLDSGCTDMVPAAMTVDEVTPANDCARTAKDAAPARATATFDSEHCEDDSIRQRVTVPPVTLEVPSAVCCRRPVAGAISMCDDTDEDDKQTVLQGQVASTSASRVDGRFVSFFQFTSNQQSTATNGADRRLKRAVRRERRATKTLAIVLGVFLFCWTPFFTVNIINAVCLRYDLLVTSSTAASTGPGSDETPSAWSALCQIDPWLFSFLVWLGYINSFLNPVIYTIFNGEFRRAFQRILDRRLRIHCGRDAWTSSPTPSGPRVAARWWRTTTNM